MSKPDQIGDISQKVAADFARIERALAPGRAMADLVKAIQPPPELAAISKMIEQTKPPAHLTAMSQMMTAMQRERGLIADLGHPPRFFAQLSKQMAQLRALSESITAPSRAFQELIQSQSSVFEKLSAQVDALDAATFTIPQFAQANLAWNVASIGLANRMKEIDLLSRRVSLSARLLTAPVAYTNFVQHTTELLAGNPAPEIASRLRGSLNLAEQQLIDNADIVTRFIVLPDDEDELDEGRELTAPFTQQDEILADGAFADETDTEAMIVVSPTAQAVQRGRRVLELVTQCNEAGKTSASGVEIFKPTTRLMTVFNDLPWLSSTDRSRFADVVDCLYFIFYEGAGKDKLRFLDKHGGPLTDAECDLIWCIKHLRNKWSRHDADHGKEKDIRKSWDELAKKFHWLGLAEHPTEPRHFRQLHYQLLVLAEDFLGLILSRLKLK